MTAPSDKIVEGTGSGDLINGSYAGDPDGDLIDNNDGNPTLASGDDDSIIGYEGNDTILGGVGNDTIYGGGSNPDELTLDLTADPYWGMNYSTGANIGDGALGGTFHVGDVNSSQLTPQYLTVTDGNTTLTSGETIEVTFLDENGVEVVFTGTVQQSAYGGTPNVGAITAVGTDQDGNPIAIALGRGDGVTPNWPAGTTFEDTDDAFDAATGVDMILAPSGVDFGGASLAWCDGLCHRLKDGGKFMGQRRGFAPNRAYVARWWVRGKPCNIHIRCAGFQIDCHVWDQRNT